MTFAPLTTRHALVLGQLTLAWPVHHQEQTRLSNHEDKPYCPWHNKDKVHCQSHQDPSQSRLWTEASDGWTPSRLRPRPRIRIRTRVPSNTSISFKIRDLVSQTPKTTTTKILCFSSTLSATTAWRPSVFMSSEMPKRQPDALCQ
ncbi:MAG: hypothetical protein BYD32DRAFT_428812 [Podila humilis]|nr:MAG: hypothetical protein BYD32DRAFT_428812 [Podila humilis]